MGLCQECEAPNIVNALIESGVRRAVFVSSTSIFSKLSTSSKSTRIQAELVIAESGLDYTIIRPTMIYGSPRDRNIWRLVNFVNKSPIVPIIGRGDAMQQPVYVDDVAQAIISAAQYDLSIVQSYDIDGAEANEESFLKCVPAPIYDSDFEEKQEKLETLFLASYDKIYTNFEEQAEKDGVGDGFRMLCSIFLETK